MVRGLLLVGIILMAIILMGCFSFFTGLTMVVYKKYHIKFWFCKSAPFNSYIIIDYHIFVFRYFREKIFIKVRKINFRWVKYFI